MTSAQNISRWHSLTLSPADRAILDQMEEEMDDKMREAIREMMDGYNDGRKDDRDQVPLGMGNRSEAYIHGWMNGRDDRLGQPRRSAASLEAHAKAIIRLYPEKPVT